tara:strand:- start:13346 stop:15049 length:1704 start_codon:yes stop_codon:yes gene_type:complete
VLYRNLLIALTLLTSQAFAASDVCLFDANDDGEFAGASEVRECESRFTALGGQIDACPIGQVACSVIAGNPICPTDPTYPCVQEDSESPFTCSARPPRNPIPPELRIEYDFDDKPYIISNPPEDRSSCVDPLIETCVTQEVPCTNPDPRFCPNPSACLQTETWNPVTGTYDVTLDCTAAGPCTETCTTTTVIDPETNQPVFGPNGEPIEITECVVTCPETPSCEINPATEEGANVCPLNQSTPCTSTFKGSPSTSCSATPEVIPEPCRLEFDQDDEPHIVCDERRASCVFDQGRHRCPFNASASACTKPENSGSYTCYVEEVACKTSEGNLIQTPVNVAPFPTSPSSEPIEDGTCAGEIRIFNGEPFSCHLAGVRSRWDNCCNNGNNIVDEALDNYWDGVVTMAEGIVDMQGTEFIIDIISIYMAGLPAYHITEALVQIGNYLLTPCADDSLTSSMIATGRCATVGTRCVESLFGTCLQEKQIECCFASKLARIINEQGRPQLGIGWGSPEAPDCRGLSPEEFQSIDFSQIDLSEYIDDMEVKSQSQIDTEVGEDVADDLIRIQGGG